MGLKKKLLIGAAVGAGAYVAYKVDPSRIQVKNSESMSAYILVQILVDHCENICTFIM